jgi:hypothetical protein
MPDLLECYMITPYNFAAAIDAAMNGNAHANESLIALSQALALIHKPNRKPTRCVCFDCDNKFSPDNLPVAFTFILPMFDDDELDHKKIMVNCVCDQCFARDQDDLDEAILKTWREVWPNIELQKPTAMQ